MIRKMFIVAFMVLLTMNLIFGQTTIEGESTTEEAITENEFETNEPMLETLYEGQDFIRGYIGGGLDETSITVRAIRKTSKKAKKVYTFGPKSKEQLT